MSAYTLDTEKDTLRKFVVAPLLEATEPGGPQRWGNPFIAYRVLSLLDALEAAGLDVDRSTFHTNGDDASWDVEFERGSRAYLMSGNLFYGGLRVSFLRDDGALGDG